METPVQLVPTACPLGGGPAADVELWPASFRPEDLTAAVFSARRAPDRVHYRMVRNRETGCIRADPILQDGHLVDLYRKSRTTWPDLEPYTVGTYLEVLRYHVWPHLPDRELVVEIGCGSGALLAALAQEGWQARRGAEPSVDACRQAPPDLQQHLVNDVFRAGLFEDGTASLVCGFQVLDHLVDPNAALAACRHLLRPGGLTAWVCHDAGHPLNRLLGRSSPIVDIEHVVLYDRHTVAKLFQNNGFDVVDVFGVANRYPFWYWLHLAPLPGVLKRGLGVFFRRDGLGRVALRANLGNLGLIARPV